MGQAHSLYLGSLADIAALIHVLKIPDLDSDQLPVGM